MSGSDAGGGNPCGCDERIKYQCARHEAEADGFEQGIHAWARDLEAELTQLIELHEPLVESSLRAEAAVQVLTDFRDRIVRPHLP